MRAIQRSDRTQRREQLRDRVGRPVGLLAAAVVCVGLTACAGGSSSATSAPSRPAAPGPTEAPEAQASSDGTAIRILVGDDVLAATLWDNPGARSLVAQLPLELEFAPYGTQEVIATPPAPITMEGMPEGDSPLAGDVGYYAPTGVVSFHLADIGFFTGSARLGRIEGSLDPLLGRTDSFSVRMERAD